MSQTPTPKSLQHSSFGVINIPSPDNKSLIYCTLAKIYPDQTKKYRISYFKQYENTLNLYGMEYPTKNKHIDIFEIFNENIAINVYTFENGKLAPHRLSKHQTREHKINLLLLENNHYCLIGNLTKIMQQQPSYISTPKSLKQPKIGLINVNNKDQKSLLWSVLAQIHPDESRNHRVSFYKKFESEINTSGVNFPSKIEDLTTFEDNNPDISINVFIYENKNLYAKRLTVHKDRKHHVNLLMLEELNNWHYCLITDLSKALTTLAPTKRTLHVCNYCFNTFTNVDLLNTHRCIPNITSPQKSSYTGLPKKLHKNKGVVNLKNHDHKSFLWSVIYAQKRRANEFSIDFYKQFEQEINVEGIEFPMGMEDFETFEKMNTDLSVNVIGYEEGEMFPVYLTKNTEATKHVNILQLKNYKIGGFHFCCVTNLSKLLSHLTKHVGALYYCKFCLQRISSARLLEEHMQYCAHYGGQATKMPSEKNRELYFKSYTDCHRTTFSIYADLECFLK